jgi:phosphoribosylformylglycinamidine synthase
MQGDKKVEMNFVAVQRDDAEMEQKLYRIIRTCMERGSDNPICSIRDQGAGGNGKWRRGYADMEQAYSYGTLSR